MLKIIFGFSRVKMFVETEYIKFFLEKLPTSDIKSIIHHKTTKLEGELACIKNYLNYETVVITISNRKREILAKFKLEFDEFISKEREKKFEEITRLRQLKNINKAKEKSKSKKRRTKKGSKKVNNNKFWV